MFKLRVFFLSFILIVFSLSVYAKEALDIEQSAQINIVGMWQSEPFLAQLGFIQSSYTFNTDSSFSNKLDMKSICEESYGQDCQYFWMIVEGTYSVKNGVLTLSIKEDKKVILRKGQSKPDVRINTDYPRSVQHIVKLDAENLVINNIKNTESVIFKPFLATEQDENSQSVSAFPKPFLATEQDGNTPSVNALWNDSGDDGVIAFWIYHNLGYCPQLRKEGHPLVFADSKEQISKAQIKVEDLKYCFELGEGKRCQSGFVEIEFLPEKKQYKGRISIEMSDKTTRKENFIAGYCPPGSL